MAKNLALNATLRTESGKNAMRRLRKSGFIPGIVFGRSGETTPVSFEPGDLEKIIHSESGFNTLFTINVDGAPKDSANPMVIIKEYQVEPVTHDFLHVSFYRIHMDRLVEVNIPIVARGEAPGVKMYGGVLDMTMREVTVECYPADIPENIEVDISTFEINDAVRVGELTVDEKVKILAEDDAVVLQINPPRKIEEPVVEEELEEGEVPEGEEPEEGASEEKAED